MIIPTDGNSEFFANGDPASHSALDELEALAIDLVSDAPVLRFRSYGHEHEGNIVVFSSEYDEANPFDERVDVSISRGPSASTALQITHDSKRQIDSFSLYIPPYDENAVHEAVEIAGALLEADYHEEVERKVVSDLFTIAAVKAMETGEGGFIEALSANYTTPEFFAATVGALVMQHASEGVRNRSLEGFLYGGASFVSVSKKEVVNEEELPSIPKFPILSIEHVDEAAGKRYCYTKNVVGDRELESDLVSDEEDVDMRQDPEEDLDKLNELFKMNQPGARDVESLRRVLVDARTQGLVACEQQD